MAARGVCRLGKNVYSHLLSALAPPNTHTRLNCHLKPAALSHQGFAPHPASHLQHVLGSDVVTTFTATPWLPPTGPLILSYRDDLRREQFNRIVGKIGIRKKDAGIYWNQYKTKRIKIRKRRRVI